MRFWPRRVGVVTAAAMLAMVGVACCSSNGTKYKSESAVDIHAALKLKGEAEQFTRLQAIAARPYLRSSDQVLLVDETLRSRLPAGQKADVLITLVKNPSVTVAAKAHLLEATNCGVLPAPQQQMVLREMVDNPAGRLYADEDAPAPVIDAVRRPAPITTSVQAADAPPTAEAAAPAPPAPAPAPAPAVKPVEQPEPITITPLPVK